MSLCKGLKSIDDFIEATDKEMYKEKLEKKMFK